MWESQVLLTDGQVVFLGILWFAPTFDEQSAQYKWNIFEKVVKPKSKKKKKKKKSAEKFDTFLFLYKIMWVLINGASLRQLW